jgi:acyl-CoA hydrolase
MDGDAIYFRGRASEERAAAMKCAHPNARRSHLEMARRYDTQAKALDPPKLEIAVAIRR